MLKFVLGLWIGLLVGLVFFHHQVVKVDTYSFKIAYMMGRIDQSKVDDTDTLVIPFACGIYNEGQYSQHVPYGYTHDKADSELKKLCSVLPVNPEQ